MARTKRSGRRKRKRSSSSELEYGAKRQKTAEEEGSAAAGPDDGSDSAPKHVIFHDSDDERVGEGRSESSSATQHAAVQEASPEGAEGTESAETAEPVTQKEKGSGKATKQAAKHSGPRKKKQPKEKKLYGNYDKYYGYRHVRGQVDPRLLAMEKEWFEGKMVLDVGCNSGIITLSVAADFRPQHIKGVDIDASLIRQCEKNKKWWQASMQEAAGSGWLPSGDGQERDTRPSNRSQFFPVSLPRCRDTSAVEEASQNLTIFTPEPSAFPFNVSFAACDMLQDTNLQESFYDVVMCLSVTKWVHLMHGDEGIMKLFHKIFALLKPGGKFILEPQPWRSYRKKYCLCDTFRKNFREIKIRPVDFAGVLQREVGFSSITVLPQPMKSEKKGFRRPVFLCHKPEHTSTPGAPSSASAPSSTSSAPAASSSSTDASSTSPTSAQS